ncbi:MAG: hypothetical protein NTX53_17125 [candidate division WOR-3 bacterium]|nr:hypothetical protein [candidate division WOR-3 bacterium]
MNKKVIAVAVAAVAALVVLYLYSFGPLAKQRHAARPRPESLKPAAGTVQGTVAYHNRDSRENYYGITVPKAWQTRAGEKPGSYSFSFGAGAGTVELMDVPDNSTLELYILSQEEPRLKAAAPGFARRNYGKQTVGGVEAFRLAYRSLIDGTEYENAREYFTGQDMAGVMTFTTPRTDSSFRAAIDSVINGFKWEN